jgi:hypothetical protein
MASTRPPGKPGRKRDPSSSSQRHGHFDKSAHSAYFSGELEDLELFEDELSVAVDRLPEAPAPA